MNRKNMLVAIKTLFEAIKGADKVDFFKFKSFVETETIPGFYYPPTKKPTGWINVTINIRLWKKEK